MPLGFTYPLPISWNFINKIFTTLNSTWLPTAWILYAILYTCVLDVKRYLNNSIRYSIYPRIILVSWKLFLRQRKHFSTSPLSGSWGLMWKCHGRSYHGDHFLMLVIKINWYTMPSLSLNWVCIFVSCFCQYHSRWLTLLGFCIIPGSGILVHWLLWWVW